MMKTILTCVCAILATLTAFEASGDAKPKVQEAKIEVTERGFEPASLKLKRDTLARVTFLRKTDATCAKEVVFPDFGIRKDLPLNEPIVISFTPKKRGEFTFSCGMGMVRGKLIVL